TGRRTLCRRVIPFPLWAASRESERFESTARSGAPSGRSADDIDAIDKQPPGRSGLSRDVRPAARRAVLEDLSLVNPALIAAYPLRNGQVLPPLADPTSASTEQYRTIKVQIEHLNR